MVQIGAWVFWRWIGGFGRSAGAETGTLIAAAEMGAFT